MARFRAGVGDTGVALRMALACAFLLLAWASAASAKTPVIERLIVQPQVSVQPLATTPTSRPFLAAREDLGARGYVEEEFLISGSARTYEWADGSLKIRPVTAPGPYTTRILVRRPIDPRRFSGDIEVETLNATTGMDITTTMATSGDYLMRRGDVWIGLTSKPLTLRALKRFDPARYAGLDWGNPAPPAQRCARPSIIPRYAYGEGVDPDKVPPASFPDSEDGLIWDIYAQLGALLKSDRRDLILPGFSKPRLFATGYSQSGMIQRTFISGFHDVMRLADGGPIYDGYLVEVGPAMLRINQCSADILPGDPRNRLPVVDVPVINIVSEGDMWLGLQTRQPDDVRARSGLVTYEIAGAAHRAGMGDSGRPTPDEARRAGFASPAIPTPTDVVLNDMPRGYLSTAALHNLKAWALDGRPPPQARPIAAAGRDIARDAHGNALGGVRTPWVEAPTATYQGALGLGALSIVGRKTPFTTETLRKLYPARGDYAAKVRSSAERLVAERWLLPEDGKAIADRASAEDAP